MIDIVLRKYEGLSKTKPYTIVGLFIYKKAHLNVTKSQQTTDLRPYKRIFQGQLYFGRNEKAWFLAGNLYAFLTGTVDSKGGRFAKGVTRATGKRPKIW
ncbi:hypothetical protein GCM10023210_20170 [Chryseobacterium ginsengisoli]|uniref:Uncharacterized protein n=1 Tax=Chryseobacterium ginsengisoli TaxID=363853 RepID=A0ABP9M9B8_9FLAO